MIFRVDNKFSCEKCGACCQKFGNGSRNYLPLYDWEVNELKKISKSRNIDLDIRPVSVFYDSITKKFFAVIYGLFNPPCPFYSKEKGCTIYEKRPFVCRTFPLFWLPSTVPDKIFGIHCFGHCNLFNHDLFLQSLTKKLLTTKGLSRRVHNYYGDCYFYCLNSNKVNLFITKLLRKTEDKKIICPTKIDSRVSGIGIFPFFEFLVNNKTISEKQKQKILNRFNKLKKI